MEKGCEIVYKQNNDRGKNIVISNKQKLNLLNMTKKKIELKTQENMYLSARVSVVSIPEINLQSSDCWYQQR